MPSFRYLALAFVTAFMGIAVNLVTAHLPDRFQHHIPVSWWSWMLVFLVLGLVTAVLQRHGERKERLHHGESEQFQWQTASFPLYWLFAFRLLRRPFVLRPFIKRQVAFHQNYLVSCPVQQLIQSSGLPLAETLLNHYPKLIVLGEPGIGKTVALHQVCSRLAHGYSIIRRSGSLPILIELRQYAGRTLIEAILSTLRIGDFALIEDLATDGRMTLLLDGLNELGTEALANFCRDIEQIQTAYPAIKMVISCRDRDFDRDFDEKREFDAAIFKRVRLSGFTNEDIKQILSSALGQDRALGIWAAMDEALKSLCRIPFVLNRLILSQIQEGSEPLSKPKGRLYQQFVEKTLVHDWQNARQNALAETMPEDLFAKNYLLSEVAWQMYQDVQARTRISRERLREPLLPQILGDLKQRGIVMNGPIDTVLECLAKSPLLQVIDGQMEFLHESIQEYFLALKLRQLYADGEDIVPFSETWDNTFVLLASLLDLPDGLMLRLLEKKPFLAARCYLQCRDISPTAIERLRDTLIRLATTSTVHERDEAAELLYQLIEEHLVPESLLRGTAEGLASILLGDEVGGRSFAAAALAKIPNHLPDAMLAPLVERVLGMALLDVTCLHPKVPLDLVFSMWSRLSADVDLFSTVILQFGEHQLLGSPIVAPYVDWLIQSNQNTQDIAELLSECLRGQPIEKQLVAALSPWILGMSIPTRPDLLEPCRMLSSLV